ncbi:MAG: MFS transporter [Clostridia bacterium]|nr:MFS transporter [Clostridia bacterium]MDH7572877.1 MFS transporter [Clostridia bacterium]
MSEPPLQTERLWTRNFILLLAANLASYVSFYMLVPSLPVYIKAITGKDALSGLAFAVFLLAAVLFRPFAGRSIDTGNRKGIFLAGSAVCFFSALALNCAPALSVILLARFVQGLGWAYCNTAAGTLASDTIPKPRLAEGMGYYGLSLSVAVGIGPALALFLSQRYSFQLMFYVCAGSVLLSFWLAVFMNYCRPGRTSESAAGVKAAFLEKAALAPSLVMLFLFIAYAAIFSFLALFGQHRQVADVGPFFTAYAVSVAVSRPLFGRLADRRGYDIVVVPGLLLCILTLLIIYWARTLPVFTLAGMVYGMGFGAVQPTMQALSVSYVPPERRGSATATYFLFVDLGLGLGSVLWGLVAEKFGYDSMYLMVIIPSLLCLLLYLFFARRAKGGDLTRGWQEENPPLAS